MTNMPWNPMGNNAPWNPQSIGASLLQNSLATYNLNQSQPETLKQVTGIEGAKAYQTPPNSTVALFDSNSDYMYIKSTDSGGYPTIRMFTFQEVFPNQQQTPSGDYVTKQEFEQFKQEVLNAQQPVLQQPRTESEPVVCSGEPAPAGEASL